MQLVIKSEEDVLKIQLELKWSTTIDLEDPKNASVKEAVLDELRATCDEPNDGEDYTPADYHDAIRQLLKDDLSIIVDDLNFDEDNFDIVLLDAKDNKLIGAEG